MNEKQRLLIEIVRVLNLMNLDHLDRVLYVEDGRYITLGHTVPDRKNKDGNFLRLKTLLLSLTEDIKLRKGHTEKQVIELLIDGYTAQEVSVELGLTKQRISQIRIKFRKRLEELHLKDYLLQGKYKL